jgi:hypothetical protein
MWKNRVRLFEGPSKLRSAPAEAMMAQSFVERAYFKTDSKEG